MIPIEYELEKLTKTCYDMFDIVTLQMQKCQKVILENDTELGDDIVRKEIRVNAFELNIERECENILALKTPAATDFRFVIAILKISGYLERIGDHAFHIAEFKVNNIIDFEPKVFKELGIDAMFKTCIEMLGEVFTALESKNTELAKSLFKKDKVLDKITEKAPRFWTNSLMEKTENFRNTCPCTA
jgi:phosphate transport system protein